MRQVPRGADNPTPPPPRPHPSVYTAALDLPAPLAVNSEDPPLCFPFGRLQAGGAPKPQARDTCGRRHARPLTVPDLVAGGAPSPGPPGGFLGRVLSVRGLSPSREGHIKITLDGHLKK